MCASGNVEMDIAALQSQMEEDADQQGLNVTLYNRYLAQAKSSHDCPLCGRDFPSDTELRSFETRIHRFIADFPATRKREEEVRQQRMDRLARLHHVLPMQSDVARLRDREIPATQRELKRLRTDIQHTQSQLSDDQTQLSEENATLENWRSLKRDTEDILRNYKANQDLQREIEASQSQHSSQGDAARSMSVISTAMTAAEEKLY